MAETEVKDGEEGFGRWSEKEESLQNRCRNKPAHLKTGSRVEKPLRLCYRDRVQPRQESQLIKA